MFCMDFRSPVFDNNHRPTYTASIARNVHSTVVMIDIDADKLAYPSSSTKSSKLRDESGRIPCQTDNCTIDVHNKCMRAVYLRSGRQTDI